MKKLVKRYRVSKFKCFMNGLVFALITVIALIFCLNNITDEMPMKADIILPFCIAIISMLMGITTMLVNIGLRKDTIKYAK